MHSTKVRSLIILWGILILTLAIPFFSHAQLSVTGQVKDSAVGGMQNAVVAALRAKDSTMAQYTRADADGKFELKLKDSGKYIFLVTYPNYGDLVLDQNIQNPLSELGLLTLIPKSKLLEELIVQQRVAAVHMKGDTTEFMADSFHVQANASVEDLLKKMPGIQIDKNGNIKAQGQAIKKVLVDGEEFFGDDPTLVTKNLRADMVDKVQLYDKGSDQAAFTGIDDGVKDKTLNIKLKEDKKKGVFGKLSAGGGTNGFHESSAMINKFKKKEKIAVYGIAANTGKVGLSWQENNQYSSNSLVTMLGDDGSVQNYFTSGGDESWGGQYDGSGIPLSQTAGAHYGNKWNDNKQSINTNYKMANLSIKGNSISNTQTNLPTTVNYSKTDNSFKNQSLRNKVDAMFESDIDSSFSIKAQVSGQLKHTQTDNRYHTITMREDSSLLNNSNRIVTNEGDNNTFSGSILLRKKFKKTGRTLSALIMEDLSSIHSSGYLNTVNRYFDSSSQFTDSAYTNQLKTNVVRTSELNVRLVYTEPLSKVSSLFVNYGLIVNNSHANKRSYNQNLAGAYSALDSLYSNEYQFDQVTHRMGLGYNFSKKKMRFNIGTNVMAIHYDQTNVFNQSGKRSRSFLNWNPTASFNYSFTSQRRLRFYYSGQTSQPSLDQIQPIQTNIDPLNVYIGNADLKPSFSNRISLNFSDYKMLTDRDFYLGVSGGNTQNQITTNTITDETTGKNTYQYVNVNGNANVNVYFGTYLKSKKLNLNYGFSPEFSWNRNVNFSNGARNISNAYNYSLNTFLSKSKDSTYDINLSVTPSYTVNRASLQPTLNNNFFGMTVNPNFDLYAIKKWVIHTDLDYLYQDKTQTFSRLSRGLVNASIARKFLPGDKLLLKLAAFDLFNKNIGQNRSMSNNIITQNIYTTVRRYFLLSLTWNFTSGFKAAPSE